MKKKTLSNFFRSEWLLNPARFFVVVSLVFGTAFLLINPPGFGLDERAHFMRAYEVSQGHFGSVRVGSDQHLGAYLPDNLNQWVNVSTADLLDNDPNVYFLKRHDTNRAAYKSFFNKQFSSSKRDDPLSDNQLAGAYGYSPVGYLHLALAIRAGESLGMTFMHIFYFTRVVNLLLYVSLVYIAIRIIPRFKWLIAAVALLPASLFQATVVSLDPVAIGAVLLLFSYIIKLWYASEDQGLRLKDGLATICLLGLLALTKAPYIVILLMLLALPGSRFSTRKQLYSWKLAWLLIPTILFMGWMLYNSQVSADVVHVQQGTGGDIKAQVVSMIHNPTRFPLAFLRTFHDGIDVMLAGMTGKIGDRFIGLQNAYLYLLFMSTAVLAAFAYDRDNDKRLQVKGESRRFTMALILTSVTLIVGVALSLYITYTPIGELRIAGLQGRYFISILPVVLLLLARTLPVRVTTNEKNITIFLQVSILLFLSTTAIIYYLVNY
jgi:uncharacterized membrane protein